MAIPGRYAMVALPLGFKFHTGGFSGLTYSIPEDFSETARIGTRVVVPLGKRYVTGVLAAITDTAPPNVKVRPIADVLDSQPVFDATFLEWTKWIAEYYLTSWGDVLEAALPQGFRPETKTKATLITNDVTREIAAMSRKAPKRAEALRAISAYPNGVFLTHLAKQKKLRGIYAHIYQLERDGFIRVETPETGSAKPRHERTVLLPERFRADPAAFAEALESLSRAKRQSAILLALQRHHQLRPDDPPTPAELMHEAKATFGILSNLAEKHFIEYGSREVSFVKKTPASHIPEEHIDRLTLTDEQSDAVLRIGDALDAGEAKTFLVHGITGSGKTEVYIALARKVLASGGGVLILVPEISLTPQLIERFERRLAVTSSSEIAVLHSKMPLAERYESWKHLTDGIARIAIGARSAVFAPVKDLKLIVVDEEHEVTFKQYDAAPRYHARDAAVMRARMTGAVCVLGSATPSVESYYNGEQGKYQLIKLTRRAQEAGLPSVEIVDLRRTHPVSKEQEAKRSSFSPRLREAIEARLARREGVVLLQNRRGFSTYIGCSKCGDVVMCPNCAVTLTYHTVGERMQCHYCGYVAPKPATCPTCGSDRLYKGGVGTQKVEEEITEIFPAAKVARMDLDTTARKGSFTKILDAFGKGEADMLLGTQMVAKGLDFPRVTLVGVINADTTLALPDFRSSERTFQLLSQVSGRAGRKELPGEVLIQTMQPLHYAMRRVIEHDYESFYREELPMRRAIGYPPYSRLILLEFRGVKESDVHPAALAFATLMPRSSRFHEMLGPATPEIRKLRGEFRWHILIKNFKKEDPSGEKMRRLLAGALERYHERLAKQSVKLIVDVDVQGLL